VEVALGEARAARAEGRLEATRAALSGLVVEQVPPELRAPLLELQTSVRLIGGELDQAVSLAREAGAAFGAAGDRAGCSRAFLLEAEALYRVGDVPAAIVAFDRAHREAATAGARREELGSLWRLARVRRSLGQHELARLELEEALDLARELRALSTEGAVLRELGNLDLAMGDGERAGEHFRQAIERLEAGGFRGDTATTRISLGELARARGDLEQAHAEYTVAHDTTMAYGITEDAVVALLDLAIVELAQSERQDVCERLREVDRLLPPGAASRLRPYIEALRLVVQASDRDWPGAVATLERLDGALMASAGDPDLLALVELAARRMAAAAPGALAVATIELARKMASGQGNHSRATLLDQQLATLRAE
jgi:tetratricopeptide (TPR) repeat protein